MADKKILIEDLLPITENLSYADFTKLVTNYTNKHKTDLRKEIEKASVLILQSKLEKLNINSRCPKCNSNKVVKYGLKQDIQIYKCKDCNNHFSRFSGTVLEKTRWHWELWVKMLQMTISNTPLFEMQNILEKDYDCVGINIKTVWLWRMKLIHALASMPLPKLTGVIQIDETFVRESQKGSRELVSFIKKETRHPRYGRRASKYGVMGPEFATLVTAIDSKGYCVNIVSALGRLTAEQFFNIFDGYFDKPSYICTDANPIYKDYCKHKHYLHYVKPSDYIDVIDKAGYETPDYSKPALAKVTEDKNEAILKDLYKKELIDSIHDPKGKKLTYNDFFNVKNAYSLSLARVNELHSDIKHFINADMTNVSTKYLQDYIGFFTYIRNWRVKNGRYPSSLVDAEEIMLTILQTRVNYTITEISEAELELPKPTDSYTTMLKKETLLARTVSKNQYFKFNPEDGLKTFKKRDYLFDLPRYKLNKIGKECKIRGYTKMSKWALVSKILELPNASEIIYKLLCEDRSNPIDEEDILEIEAGKYKMKIRKK